MLEGYIIKGYMSAKISFNILFCITMLFISLCPSAKADQGIIHVTYPPDKTVMEFNILGISLKTDINSTDLIKAYVNDEEIKSIVPDSKFECFSVPLIVGVNKIHIIAFKDSSQVDEAGISVFRRSELSKEHTIPPPGFNKDFFHMKDRFTCTRCHTLKPGMLDKKPVDISAFPTRTLTDEIKTAATTSTCYSCHKALTAYPFVHGPAAVWSCLSCHEDGAKPNYSVSKPDTRMCLSCHIEQKEKWETRKYFHGPFNTGKCAICHNPHAADYPFNLMNSTWDLCVSCHIDKGSGKHILERHMFASGTFFHPTRGVPDPLRTGKELTCASCHHPHASHSPRLLRFNVPNGFSLCRKCHAD